MVVGVEITATHVVEAGILALAEMPFALVVVFPTLTQIILPN
jgi:hypothetical protein